MEGKHGLKTTEAGTLWFYLHANRNTINMAPSLHNRTEALTGNNEVSAKEGMTPSKGTINYLQEII